ncbi:MAG: PA14 domain-containing protein [Syntrophomonas sp.]
MKSMVKNKLVAVCSILAVFIYVFSYNIPPVTATVPAYVNGVLGQYYDTAEPSKISYKRLIQIDQNIRFNWQTESPDASIAPDTFSVVWSGYLEVPVTGNYDFYTYSDDGVQLTIGSGEAPIINRWGLVNLDFTKSSHPLYLQKGAKYPFTLKYQELPINATIVLFWQRDGGEMGIVPASAFYVCQNHYSKYSSPVHVNALQASGTGLKGEYYTGAQTVVEGDAGIAHTVEGENINGEWGLESPAPGIPEDDFSARWTGYLEARYTEDIILQIVSDDGVRMWIDDNLVLDKWEAASNVLHEVSIPMENGKFYKIKVEYNDLYGSATCVLYWKSDAEDREVIPAKYLYSSQPEPNPPGPDPDPGPCSGDPEPPDPEPEPNEEFINYLMNENLYVYGNNAAIDGSSQIIGPDSTVVVRQNFNPGNGDVSYIATKKIYIKGNVTLGGSAGLGSFDGTSTIYVDGNVKVTGGSATAGHDGRIFGNLYYTGNLNVATGITLVAQTQKVNSIEFPQFEIPALRADDWYSEKGYTSTPTPQNGMKYYGNSFTFPTWDTYSNVTIASKGDITLPNNVQVTGILFAPNGKVSITGSSSFTGIIVAKELLVSGSSTVTFQDITDASQLPF